MTPEEIERRRILSVATMQERERKEFGRRYQEMCDKEYWRNGQCCAGCDFWQSDAGGIGRCTAAGIVSGEQVLKSLDIMFSSYVPKPGFPFTKSHDWCGKFRDDFDWSTLPEDYQKRVGVKHEKPTKPAA